jgi:ankyrin repeat protein
LIKKGAEPSSAAFVERPLNVSKDKFTRNVLQNLNKAAGQANDIDIKYLVNCGSKIDNRQSIFGEAPIHKAVLSDEGNKEKTLKAIIEDCNANVNNMDSNGWSALHHAAYIGDVSSATVLIESGAKVNAYSN